VIDYLRQRSDALERALARYDCALAAVTVYELEVGFAHSPQQGTLFEELVHAFEVLPLHQEAARAAARVYGQLRAQGLPIGVQDTLTAGTCIAHGVPLLTRNADHFRRIDGLSVIELSQLP
jgi:predicted nucleic acid-binding protein